MQQRTMGRTGLFVSSLGLGTLTWGRDTTADDAEQMWTMFADAGGTVIDTSPAYGDGQAQPVIGSILGRVIPRDETILVSTGGWSRVDGQQMLSNSRHALLATLDRTLSELGTDYLDVFLVSRRDPHTPFDETLSAIDIAVRSGRVRYAGVSNHSSWDTATLCALSHGLPGAIAVTESEYSLLARQVEVDLLPGVREAGLGFFAWSALARGVLSGKYRHSTPPDSRAASPLLAGFVTPYLTERCQRIVEGLAVAAEGLDRTIADVALGWIQHRPGVSCALIGPRSPLQLAQLLDGGGEPLPPAINQALDDISVSSLH